MEVSLHATERTTVTDKPDLNKLYYGDNLDVLPQHVANESVDVVYLDPPFNSKATYNVFLRDEAGVAASSQVVAFGDTWRWSYETDGLYDSIRSDSPDRVVNAVEGLFGILGKCDLMAYVVMMTPRLLQLRRVLKSSGVLLLHCDPTASHYLKVLLDSIFGQEQFRNEIVWSYKRWTASRKVLPRLHDVILFYSKSDNYHFQVPTVPNTDPNASQYVSAKDATGKTIVLRGADGKAVKRTVANDIQVGDVWEIPLLSPVSKERLGYPTQKPRRLLERVLKATTKPGFVVLDPFCGCGTTVDAAQGLGLGWIGVDISYLAVDLIDKRLRDRYGKAIEGSYEIIGNPKDLAGARALATQNKFDFERWAVSLVNGQPNDKQVGDKGSDGVIRIPTDNPRKSDRVIVSIKGGQQLVRSMVDQLAGALGTHGSPAGVLITLEEPTRGMRDAAATAGTYLNTFTKRPYPRVQVMTVQELLDGKVPDLPPVLNPYKKAARAFIEPEQIGFDFDEPTAEPEEILDETTDIQIFDE